MPHLEFPRNQNRPRTHILGANPHVGLGLPYVHKAAEPGRGRYWVVSVVAKRAADRTINKNTKGETAPELAERHANTEVIETSSVASWLSKIWSEWVGGLAYIGRSMLIYQVCRLVGDHRLPSPWMNSFRTELPFSWWCSCKYKVVTSSLPYLKQKLRDSAAVCNNLCCGPGSRCASPNKENSYSDFPVLDPIRMSAVTIKPKTGTSLRWRYWGFPW